MRVLVTVLVKNLFIPALLLCFICSIFCDCKVATQTDAVGFPRLVWTARTAGKATSNGTVFETLI